MPRIRVSRAEAKEFKRKHLLVTILKFLVNEKRAIDGKICRTQKKLFGSREWHKELSKAKAELAAARLLYEAASAEPTTWDDYHRAIYYALSKLNALVQP